jgi:8-oxo-dGTP diphosphatase
MGIGGQLVTIVVDVANVMGSRPDGWWRDRAGAAVRLHAEIARLAASGRAILRDEPREAGQPGEAGEPGEPGENKAEQASVPGFVMVLEGAAKAAAARLAPAEPDAQVEPDAQAKPDTPGAPSGSAAPGAALRPVRPGEVHVVQAAGSGDDAIVAVVRKLSGRRVVVTADRELRERCVAAGAEIRGPGWLLGLLRG